MMVAIILTTMCACGHKKQDIAQEQNQVAGGHEYANVGRLEVVSIDTVKKEQKLSSTYANIIFNKTQATDQILQCYSDATQQFQNNALLYLRNKNSYKQVEINKIETKFRSTKGDALVVDTKILDMRIVNSAARFWG